MDLLRARPQIGLLYVHITDYPMHTWAPEEEQSREHLLTLDGLIGEAEEAAPDAAFLLTADHGMNHKQRCWDLARVCAEAATPVRFVLSPERDYYIRHHRNLTGCAWIWLHRPADYKAVRATLAALDGVDEILPGAEAAARYHTLAERLGDMVVNGDRVTMFGELDKPFESLPPEYRAHGSLHEMRLPLIVYNHEGAPEAERFRANKDLATFLW